MGSQPPIRLQFEVDPAYRELMDDLQGRLGAGSRAEVFRRALKLLDLATFHVIDGGQLVFKEPDGDEQRLIIV